MVSTSTRNARNRPILTPMLDLFNDLYCHPSTEHLRGKSGGCQTHQKVCYGPAPTTAKAKPPQSAPHESEVVSFARLPLSVRLDMMTFFNWESLLKITHAENYISCLSDLLPVPELHIHIAQYFHRRRALTFPALCSDINSLILDYLTTEGYPSAAAKFSKEANLRPNQDEESVRARQQIQHSIHLGSIQDAIEALNELEPMVSSTTLSPLPIAMIRHVHAPLIIAFGSLMRKTLNYFSPQYEQ
jgi:hypothetical protein